MKTKSKGFTLIELLAVIIILAIIALIATPIILDVIDDAKKSAAKSEAAMIVSGVNNYCAAAKMQTQMTNATNICEDGVTNEEVATMVDLGNAKVNEIKYENGKVTKLIIESNGKTVKYEEGVFTIGDEVVGDEPSNPDTPTDGGNTEPEAVSYVPKYFSYGTPTASSTTSYTTVGKTVFVGLDEDGAQLSLCIIKDGKLECFKPGENNFATEKQHLRDVFETAEYTCNVDDFEASCIIDDFDCSFSANGGMNCFDESTSNYCEITYYGEVNCY